MKKLIFLILSLALLSCFVISASAEEVCAHTSFSIEYEDFTKTGSKTCTGCGSVFEAEPIFYPQGYSNETIDENGYPMLTCSYLVDLDALEQYRNSGYTLNFGILYANAEYLGANAPLSVENGAIVKYDESGKIQVLDLEGGAYSTVDGKARYKTSTYFHNDLYMCMYLFDGESIHYVNEEGCDSLPEKVAYYNAELELTLPNTSKYIYRVGNINSVTFGTLFACVKGEITSLDIDIECIDKNAGVTYTISENALDWTKSSIQFNGTGIIKLTASATRANSVEVYLEVVNARNVTSAKSSTNENIVLLSDISISAGGAVYYNNCAIYGNGFTFSVKGGVNTQSSNGTNYHGIINLTSSTMDNLVVVGDVYDKYGAYTYQEDYTAAICAIDSIIQNCHISNCSAPVRSQGNNKIVNTTLYGGTIANLIIEGGVNTLKNVTTVNYNDGRSVVGFGILVSESATESTKLILEDTLKQYNFLAESDGDMISDQYAQKLFNAMFDSSNSAYHFTVGNERYVMPAILSLTSTFDGSDITDNANTGYVAGTPSIELQAGISANGFIYSMTSSGNTVNNGYDASSDSHISSVQGNILPSFDFSLGEQNDPIEGNEDNAYIYYDGNKIYALYTKGENPVTLNIDGLATAHKYGSYTVVAACIDENGNAVGVNNGTVTLTEAGTYKLVFTVTDTEFYGPDGKKTGEYAEISYEVELSLSVKAPAVENATISVNNANGTYVKTGYFWDYDYYIQFNIADAIKITDNGASFDLNAGTAEVSYSVAGNAFSGTVTVTITYEGGQVLTVTLANATFGTPKTKTISVNGSVIKSDGAADNKSDGTWTITSVSFKGSNGATVTNNTDATITFTN